MSLTLKTAPSQEPVSLAEAKEQCRVDGTTEDALISRYVRLARTDVETLCLHKLITQVWDWRLDGFPGGAVVELPLAPVQSVKIYYTPEGGSETEYSSSYYSLDGYSFPARVRLQSTASWPGDVLVEVNGVRFEMTVGMGDEPEDVDERARQAILLLAAFYYEHREPLVVGKNVSMLPFGVSALVGDLRARMKKF